MSILWAITSFCLVKLADYDLSPRLLVGMFIFTMILDFVIVVGLLARIYPV